MQLVNDLDVPSAALPPIRKHLPFCRTRAPPPDVAAIAQAAAVVPMVQASIDGAERSSFSTLVTRFGTTEIRTIPTIGASANVVTEIAAALIAGPRSGLDSSKQFALYEHAIHLGEFSARGREHITPADSPGPRTDPGRCRAARCDRHRSPRPAGPAADTARTRDCRRAPTPVDPTPGAPSVRGSTTAARPGSCAGVRARAPAAVHVPDTARAQGNQDARRGTLGHTASAQLEQWPHVLARLQHAGRTMLGRHPQHQAAVPAAHQISPK